ncbi:MAG: protein phosphatase 2C domain-containing protein [Gemmatimonadota bacterium]
MTIAWQADGLSDTGLVRKGNEDALRMDAEKGIFIVADGMGGHAAGEVASRLAADAALDVLSQASLVTGGDVEEALHTAFHEAFRRIAECCEGDPATAGMGTTLTVAVLKESGELHIGHIGDSRAYQLSGGKLRKLTHDHTWVQQEIDSGRVAAEDAQAHPLSHILTKVLAAGDSLDPDLVHATVQPSDLLLLCSDGLYNMVDGPKLLRLLVADVPLTELTQSLVGAANKRGGADNTTVIAVRIV